MVLAVRLRATGFGGSLDGLEVTGTGTRRFALVLAVALLALLLAVLAGVLVGDRVLLPGDLGVWASGNAGPIVSGVMSTRVPRVVAALLAGAALAVAGAVVQGVTRNPLADTGIIGITGGASLLGVLVVTFLPAADFWALAWASALGAVVAGCVVFGLSARSGFATDRLLLIGVGLGVCTEASTTAVLVGTDSYNQARALTWLSGSTYGRVYEHLVPLALGCLVLVPLVSAAARSLDLLSVDEDSPVLLGMPVPRVRFSLLLGAVLLAGLAVAAIGPIAFVGLVGPHAARALVGRRHPRHPPGGAARKHRRRARGPARTQCHRADPAPRQPAECRDRGAVLLVADVPQPPDRPRSLRRCSAHRLLAVQGLPGDVGVTGVLGDLGHEVHEDTSVGPPGARLEPGCLRQLVRLIEVDGPDQLVNLGARSLEVVDQLRQALVLPEGVGIQGGTDLRGRIVPVDARPVDPRLVARSTPHESGPLALHRAHVLDQAPESELGNGVPGSSRGVVETRGGHQEQASVLAEHRQQVATLDIAHGATMPLAAPRRKGHDRRALSGAAGLPPPGRHRDQRYRQFAHTGRRRRLASALTPTS